MYSLSPIPCSVEQAADYLSFLSLHMKLSSMLVYYQSVKFFHKMFGLSAPSLSHPYLKSILGGVANIPSSRAVPKEPFTPGLLKKLAGVVALELEVHLLTWVAVVIMFRTLLRVSHLTDSEHTLKRSYVKLESWGVVLSIRSTKTLKRGDQPVLLPIVKGRDPLFCPVYWIKYIFYRFPLLGQHSPLLSTPKLPKFPYGLFSRVFKLLRQQASISGNFSSHSLRRGGASFMADKGLSLQDIKDKGLWKSDVVLRYIVPTLRARKLVDKKFSSFLS